jgi:hypothetical protein
LGETLAALAAGAPNKKKQLTSTEKNDIFSTNQKQVTNEATTPL